MLILGINSFGSSHLKLNIFQEVLNLSKVSLILVHNAPAFSFTVSQFFHSATLLQSGQLLHLPQCYWGDIPPITKPTAFTVASVPNTPIIVPTMVNSFLLSIVLGLLATNIPILILFLVV